MSKEGFSKFAQNEVVVRQNAVSTLNVSLQTAVPGTEPSLKDLGFTPTDVQGTAQAQARLDRRSHMLQIHQRLGLITLAPLVATLVTIRIYTSVYLSVWRVTFCSTLLACCGVRPGLAKSALDAVTTA